jgi:hypothetical protein
VLIAHCLLIAICLAVLLVFVLLAQYAQPSSDDFCMASGVAEHGLIRQLWNHYFEWSGRYSSNALYAIYPLLFGLFDGYKYIPLLVILALFFATAFFLSTVFKVRLYARPVLLSSLCFVSIYLLGMMSPASSLYWMAGVMTYQTANILLFVIAALMIRLAGRQKQLTGYSGLLVGLLLLMVVAIGTNETAMLALTGLAFLGFGVHLRSGWVILKPWSIIFAVTLVCFAMVYFSPGNAIRAADFPLRHDLVRSMEGSLSVGLKILWLWLSSPVLMVSSLLVPFAISRLMLLSGRMFAVSKTMIVVLMLSTFVMPVLLQLPAWWSMGGWPPARTVDAIYFLFLVSWYLTVGAFTLRYLQKNKSSPLLQPCHPVSAVVLLLLTGVFTAAVLESKAYQLARTDLFHLARPYHEYLNARYQQIEQANAAGQRYLAVTDYQQELPRTIFFNDIMRDPDHWRNVCYADYFGLERIKIKTKRTKLVKKTLSEISNKVPGKDQLLSPVPANR